MITAEQLKDIQERADALYSYLNIEEKKVEFEEEQLRTQAPDFWDDVERAQEQFDEEEAKRLQKKIQKNQFDFNDFYNQIQQIKKMGNLKDLASMIPGVGKAIRDVDIDDNAFKGIEAIIQSMTPKERTNPELLNNSRRQRIAKGSGTNIQEVNRLIKQFDQTRKMAQQIEQLNSIYARMIEAMTVNMRVAAPNVAPQQSTPESL